MKALIKVLLVLAAVGGVCYWLLSKCATPALRLRQRRRAQLDAEELMTPEEPEEPAND